MKSDAMDGSATKHGEPTSQQGEPASRQVASFRAIRPTATQGRTCRRILEGLLPGKEMQFRSQRLGLHGSLPIGRALLLGELPLRPFCRAVQPVLGNFAG